MHSDNHAPTHAGIELPGNIAPDENPKPRFQFPEPIPAARQPRKLDLTLAAMPVVGDIQPVTQLGVREMKGVGQLFTAHTDQAYQFRGLVYKGSGSYETQYQLIAGEL